MRLIRLSLSLCSSALLGCNYFRGFQWVLMGFSKGFSGEREKEGKGKGERKKRKEKRERGKEEKRKEN